MKKLLVTLICLGAFGCSGDETGTAQAPDVIRVAVLPDQAPANLRTRHQPLLDYLAESTNLEFELTTPSSYEDLQSRFAAGEFDLAWFGGLTYVRAEAIGNAEALVFRDIDIQFTSCYLTQASSGKTSIAAFEGERFSFGPKLSTSGHLMPRYFLRMEGLVPEEFFASVQHSSGHDQTASWVAEGKVDLGVANCLIVRSLLDNGQIQGEDIQVLETTPPYSDYVWASNTSMDEATRLTILDAFLSLDATVPAHRELLRLQGANAYLPAGRIDFVSIRRAARQANLLTSELPR